MSKRVLIVTPFFPPCAASGSFRMLGFAKHLPSTGWDVHVVAPAGIPSEPHDEQLSASVPACVQVHHAAYPNGNWTRCQRAFHRSLAVLDHHAVWSSPARRVASQVIRDDSPDVLLTSGPPHSVHLLGCKLRRQFGIPWVADFRDPWVAGAWGDVPRYRWKRRLEHKVVSDADLVILNAPNSLRCMQDAHPGAAHKMIAVTNGYEVAASCDGNDEESASPFDATSNALNIVHTGELYVGRDPQSIFDGMLEAVQSGINPVLNLVGRPSGKEEVLRLKARELGLQDHLRIHGQVSHRCAQRFMCEADLLLLLDSPGRRNGVPAKLYEYVGAGRPVLALAENESDTAWVLRESGISHRLAAPGNADQIRAALLASIKLVADGQLCATQNTEAGRFARAATVKTLSRQLGALISVPADGTAK